uniref:Uncharacterized protein n=1 Tax=viral metagenome TaxID=1070528 RepID=A0A6C0EY87_9ZZZZ
MADYSIYIFHVFFVAPMLILTGIYHDSPKFPEFVWHLFIILGVGVMFYHAWKMYKLYKIANSKTAF